MSDASGNDGGWGRGTAGTLGEELLLLPRPQRVEWLGAANGTTVGATGGASATGSVASGWIRLERDTRGRAAVRMAGREIASDEIRRMWRERAVPAAREGGELLTPSVEEQAYTLVTHEARAGCVATIDCGGPVGAKYGLATLDQLVRRFWATGRWPGVRIEDRPTFRVRGVMLDVSRDRVPTMQELMGVVETLAGLKINHLQLYTEHTFAYAGHEEAWRGWAPITPDEMRRLDDHCCAHGIELCANQNCFGHLASWLRLPGYAHLAETHGEWMFDVWPRSGPFSLCPTDAASLGFVEDLLSQLLACVRSRGVNIGCDETYDVGAGRSRAEVERLGGGGEGRSRVFARFVNEVAGVAERVVRSLDAGETPVAAGRGEGSTGHVNARGGGGQVGGAPPRVRPMFWGDIALSHPDRLSELSPSLTALAWNYEPDAPFDRWIEAIASRGPRPIWLCPGTSSWRSIFGRTSERRGNIHSAARAAARGLAAGRNVEGFLICDWGDTGHQQQWPVAMLGLADGANAAWNADAAGDFDARAASLHALGDATLTAGPWLARLGDADIELRRTTLGLSRPGRTGRLLNQSTLFIDMHTALNAGLSPEAGGTIEAWAAVVSRLEGLGREMPGGESLPQLLKDELALTLRVARFAARRGLERRREAIGSASPGWRAALRDELREIMADHTRTWLARARRAGPTSAAGSAAGGAASGMDVSAGMGTGVGAGGLAHSQSFYASVLRSLADD